MIKNLKSWLDKVSKLFAKKKNIKLGFYGPPNAGKTTLANKICMDWIGEEMGTVSKIPHETREVKVKEKVTIENSGKKLSFNIVDTPGIATKIDYEDFLKHKLTPVKAKQRAREATKGVIEAIKWLDNVDCVVVVLDSTKAARDIPVLIAGNKIDLPNSNLKRIEAAFPQYKVIGISAQGGENIENFYKEVFGLVK
ncbi:GTP-binding protein [Candidatus Woesearchaeota archaeon]|nr:GTP-binding protein [Candidatus Woesearchaeota archaeon]